MLLQGSLASRSFYSWFLTTSLNGARSTLESRLSNLEDDLDENALNVVMVALEELPDLEELAYVAACHNTL